MHAAHQTHLQSHLQPTPQSLANPTTGPDIRSTDPSARAGLCRRLVLLSTLADASHGTARVVLEARVHLVFRTIARGDR